MYFVIGLVSSRSLYMFCAIIFILLQLQKILYNPLLQYGKQVLHSAFNRGNYHCVLHKITNLSHKRMVFQLLKHIILTCIFGDGL